MFQVQQLKEGRCAVLAVALKPSLLLSFSRALGSVEYGQRPFLAIFKTLNTQYSVLFRWRTTPHGVPARRYLHSRSCNTSSATTFHRTLYGRHTSFLTLPFPSLLLSSLAFRGRWDKRIASLHIGNFPPSEEDNWPAANIETGSDKFVNNYNSGLWSLFHALSVSSAPMRQTPYAIMEGIHSFVFHFFR